MDSIEAEIVIEKGTLEDADKFFRAATEGDVETIVSMLESGRASVNQTDIDGFTALMIAASQGKTEAVKALLDHGADPDLITLNKENHALFFAAKVHFALFQFVDHHYRVGIQISWISSFVRTKTCWTRQTMNGVFDRCKTGLRRYSFIMGMFSRSL